MTLAVTRFINFPIDSRTQKIKSRRFPCSQSYLPLSVTSEIHEQASRSVIALIRTELSSRPKPKWVIELLADVFRQHRFRRFVGFLCFVRGLHLSSQHSESAPFRSHGVAKNACTAPLIVP